MAVPGKSKSLIVKRFAASRSGTAAIEAAFILPVFLAGLFIVVEFGRVFYSKVEFEYAVYNATRFASVSKTADSAKINQALRNSLILLNPAKLQDVTFAETKNGDNTRTANLTVTYQVDFLLPITSRRYITLSRTISFLRGS
jgi:Flp pilus assembly protein TadG